MVSLPFHPSTMVRCMPRGFIVTPQLGEPFTLCSGKFIDAIVGWSTTDIGHAYGNGYSADVLAKWMKKIEVKNAPFI